MFFSMLGKLFVVFEGRGRKAKVPALGEAGTFEKGRETAIFLVSQARFAEEEAGDHREENAQEKQNQAALVGIEIGVGSAVEEGKKIGIAVRDTDDPADERLDDAAENAGGGHDDGSRDRGDCRRKMLLQSG